MKKRTKLTKESFKHILFRYLSISLIIVIFFSIVTNLAIYEILIEVFHQIAMDDRSEYGDTIVHLFGDVSLDDDLSEIQLAMCMYGEASNQPGYIPYIFIEDSEGNIVMDAERRVFMLYRPNDITDSYDTEVYICDLDVFENCDIYDELCSSFLSSADMPIFKYMDLHTLRLSNYIYLDEAYINEENHTFLPTSFHFYPNADIMKPYNQYSLSFSEEEMEGYILADANNIVVTPILGIPVNSSFKEETMSAREAKDAWDFRYEYDIFSDRKIYDIDNNTYLIREYMKRPILSVAYDISYLIFDLFYLFVGFSIAFLLAVRRYKKNQKFYEMDEYRKTLMDSMAHDLKTPLMAMSGYAEMLKENVQTEKREYYADSVMENVQYMNDIIKNVMDLSKLESLKTDLNIEKYDLVEIIGELSEKYKPLLDGRNITLSVTGSFVYNVDKSLTLQALENILTNAVKYCDDGGFIEIIGNSKSLSIQNSTKEKPSVSADKLWEPYVKGESARAKKNGTGLGLAIVKNILDYNNLKGTIEIHDNIFNITLSKK